MLGRPLLLQLLPSRSLLWLQLPRPRQPQRSCSSQRCVLNGCKPQLPGVLDEPDAQNELFLFVCMLVWVFCSRTTD